MAKAFRRALLMAVAACSTLAIPARAEYPEKQITMVVCFPAGGGTDIAARLVNIQLGEALGKPVIIENRGGAGGNIAIQAVKRLPADGYTLLVCSSAYVVNPSLYANAAYDPVKDFVPLMVLGASPNVFVVPEKSEIKSMKEFIERAKANPDKFNWTSPGAGTTPQLAGELIKLRTGIKMQHIPFPGAGPATNAVLAGTVDLYTANIGSVQGLIDGGKVRPIAVTSKERWKPLPNVPTLDEIGIKDAESDTFQGVYTLAGTPQPIIDRLAKELSAILARADVKEKYAKIGLPVVADGPAAFLKRVQHEVPMYKEVIDKAGLKNSMSKPLAGIRVIELANFIAGPLCGTLLADMGADVVKVEPPGGDMSRATPPIRNGESVSFTALNRNKRSLVLDLKQPDAQEVMRKLAAKSDVFVEANRPGALEKMGLSAEHLKAVNPKIIYTSVSGFGQTGPDRRRAGVNLIIEAFSGVLSVTGAPGEMPMRPGVQTADVFGALFATYATLASLVGAGRTGEGRVADVSLVEASIAAAAWEAAEYLETGKVPQPMGNRHRLTAPYQLFGTSDKRYVAIGMPNNMLFQKFMQVIGLGAHLTDPRFATYAQRKANEDALLAIVEPAILKMASGELEVALMEVGVPCARVNNFEEVFEHPQIKARGVVQEIEHPRLGTMKVTRNPVLLDHGGPDIARPAPMLGEHSQEILRELGYDQAAIGKLVSGGVTKLAAPARQKATAAE